MRMLNFGVLHYKSIPTGLAKAMTNLKKQTILLKFPLTDYTSKPWLYLKFEIKQFIIIVSS